ncbi:hypothetical protein FIA58_011655 [Flavobacterium jejuense]|uniref:DUF3244 domain-containing protein n=1 Tax=Flavobacterium jejuense TaxID=1544455 RepID=A0ABX0IT95_9FLAO|nr:hypothetical protein [Flavobacterium jejuense]NHN26335.1 hypothetical protein [Flavobacterium jejuense]
MKKLVFGLIATVLFTFTGFASDKVLLNSIITIENNEMFINSTYKTTLKDNTQMSVEELNSNVFFGCLLKVTLVFTDGTSKVYYVEVEQSCEEFFASIK